MRHFILAVAVLLSFVGNRAWGEALYTVTDLGTLGGSGSNAIGINASGQVVGQSWTSSSNEHAFLYSNGAMVDLGILFGPPLTSQCRFGINASGQVVGYTNASSD